MRPFLYYHPDFAIPSFSFMLMVASLVATALPYKMAPRRGLSQIVILDMGIWGTLLAITGGRLFHVFVEEPLYYWEHPVQVLQIWRGGFVSYGAFIGLGIAWLTYLKIRRLDTWAYLDHVALFAGPIIDFCVRLGCLLAGCCFGKASPYHHLEYILFQRFYTGDAGYFFPGQALWPTQIYSMFAAVLIFLICLYVDRHRSFKGQVMMVFLISYAFLRSLIEFLRGDISRGLYFNNTISTAQMMGILTISIFLVVYFRLKKKYPINKET